MSPVATAPGRLVTGLRGAVGSGGSGGSGGTGLSSEDQNAYEAMLALLRQYGLESLASVLLGYFQEGYSEAEINLRIQETKEYKERFAGNEERRRKGLPVLSPAEYLAVESAYREIMSVAGLPVGFYDEPADFAAWIGADVSPAEIQSRVRTAAEMVNSLDTEALNAFREYYSDGDLIAYALDRERAESVLERQWRTAQIASAARLAGFDSEQDFNERLADMGISRNDAQRGYGIAATLRENVGRLSALYGGSYTSEDAAGDVFLGDSEAGRTRRRLASQERAAFSGSAGATGASVSTRTAGQT